MMTSWNSENEIQKLGRIQKQSAENQKCQNVLPPLILRSQNCGKANKTKRKDCCKLIDSSGDNSVVPSVLSNFQTSLYYKYKLKFVIVLVM